MFCSVKVRFWRTPCAAVILVLGAAGCVMKPLVRPEPCMLPISCSSLFMCAQPGPCTPASLPSQSSPPSRTESIPPPGVSPQSTLTQSLIFPPQRVMESGSYTDFFKENEKIVLYCQQKNEKGCDVALFNLGFVYASTTSPYRDLTKAVAQFEMLNRLYPESPYAPQGQIWRTLILERVAMEENLRTTQAQLRRKDTTMRMLQEQLQRVRTLDIEMQEKERQLFQSR